jgi:uncharacterized membrane protein
MFRFARATLVFLCLAVSLYAVAVYGLLPVGALVHPDMKPAYEARAGAIALHVFSAVFALALGPFQFNAGLRARRPNLHRAMGRLYLGVGVLVGGLSGLYLAAGAFGGPVARLGFATLALAWLYTGWKAYSAIRAGEVASHRAWMTANFALTAAAVTLRIYLPLSMVAGIPFQVAYPAIAWLCWVPNLLAAGYILGRCRSSSSPKLPSPLATFPSSTTPTS